jgi:hypothetical protein
MELHVFKATILKKFNFFGAWNHVTTHIGIKCDLDFSRPCFFLQHVSSNICSCGTTDHCTMLHYL